MKFILGKKIEMNQRYQGDKVAPITIVKAGPCFVSQVRTMERDGYSALQVGFDYKKHPSKAMQGHLKGVHLPKDKTFRFIKEFRLDKELVDVNKGDFIDVSSFNIGDKVKVTSRTKGRGFTGVVKRHNFAGHPPTHGHKDQERMPGSIGAGGIQRVFKGQRMGGRYGYEQVTVANLEIIDIDKENALLYIKGAIPGARNSLVKIVSAQGEMTFMKTEAKAEQKTPEVSKEVNEVVDKGVEAASSEQPAVEDAKQPETIVNEDKKD